MPRLTEALAYRGQYKKFINYGKQKVPTPTVSVKNEVKEISERRRRKSHSSLT